MTDQAADAPAAATRAGAQPNRSASIVLGFESIIVFLGGLAIYGLKALPEPHRAVVGHRRRRRARARSCCSPPACCATAGGSSLGWVLQVVVALGGFLVPALVLVALIFGGMWAYATIKGASLDARNARLAAEADTANGD